jgi:hypothetical protein
LNCGCVGYVGGICYGTATAFLDHTNRFVQFVRGTRRDSYDGAGRSERLGNRSSNASAAAGHEGNLILQARCL